MALEASASLNILRASRSAGVTTLRSNVSFILNPRWLSLERFGAIAAFRGISWPPVAACNYRSLLSSNSVNAPEKALFQAAGAIGFRQKWQGRRSVGTD